MKTQLLQVSNRAALLIFNCQDKPMVRKSCNIQYQNGAINWEIEAGGTTGSSTGSCTQQQELEKQKTVWEKLEEWLGNTMRGDGEASPIMIGKFTTFKISVFDGTCLWELYCKHWSSSCPQPVNWCRESYSPKTGYTFSVFHVWHCFRRLFAKNKTKRESARITVYTLRICHVIFIFLCCVSQNSFDFLREEYSMCAHNVQNAKWC